MNRAWTRTGTVALVLGLVAAGAGCATDQPLDPTGNWAITVTYGTGTCGLTGASTSTITVTKGPNGYVIAESDPNVTVSGTVTCTPDSCKLSVSETGTISGNPATLAYNIAAGVDDKISGSGSISISGSAACTQAFTVTGTKS